MRRVSPVTLAVPSPGPGPLPGMTFKNNKVLCYKDFIKTFKDFFESVSTILMEF